mmetsp:Transcript_7867/g.27640  ORF Transcript_7867/g.27640 Transcript_7867/m.27640 type:complete len:226 (+) Transcript_7867:106-783(+)|eukprot:CAMPEP_0183789648 /NCGR_PEP_ID=MMETSP0803_2-20130417/552_1 /TAXON_ID=195967 /ORGANISM="Crustomastix stigmata, Strain CCMP3273" /LENGTH=225 /DNA_ID=CAMNT_0026033823 /DNA_START=108 /DNA_END=785 /DNA_ORIENTATION=+
MSDWTSFLDQVRKKIFSLGTAVKDYETFVAVQGTDREDVEARVNHSKKREECRALCVSLQEELMMHMAEGSAPDKKSLFFVECYNFSSCVERFRTQLDKSMKKDKKRLESCKRELQKVNASKQVSDEDRAMAEDQLQQVAEITEKKTTQCQKIKDNMGALVTQLREAANDESAVGKAPNEEDYDEGAGLLNEENKKKVPYVMVGFLILVATILGSVRWYLWWTAQ